MTDKSVPALLPLTVVFASLVFLVLFSGMNTGPGDKLSAKTENISGRIDALAARLEALEGRIGDFAENGVTALSPSGAAAQQERELARIADGVEKVASNLYQASDYWLRDISGNLESISSELVNIRRAIESSR
jgi:hypothetical protein